MMRLLSGLRARRSDAAAAYRRSEPARPDTQWRDAAFVVVDLETTGLDPRHDEIISFAAIPIDGGRVGAGRARTAVVRPRHMPDAATIRIHGLRPEDLAAAPPLTDVLDQILDSLAGRVLVAHAAWVERGFLAAALRTAGLRIAEPVLDTSALVRHVLDDGAGADDKVMRLSDAVDRLGLPVHRPHHAAGDALTTAQLFIAVAVHLDATEPQTVGSLARLSEG
jgi:DNA polymerase III subunit epsilon